VAPIGELAWEDGALAIPGGGALGDRLRNAILAVQRGEAPDGPGWLEAI
jgi:branched-chain amino acid aminotransferase